MKIKLDKPSYYIHDHIEATIIVDNLDQYETLKAKQIDVFIYDFRGEDVAHKALPLRKHRVGISPRIGALNKLPKIYNKSHMKHGRNLKTDQTKYYAVNFNLRVLDLPLGKYWVVARLGDTFSAKKKFVITNRKSKPKASTKEVRTAVRGITLQLNTNKKRYSLRDTIKIAIVVKNNSKKKTKRLSFRTGQLYDFELIYKSNSRSYWKWSRGRYFTQALQVESIGPHKKKIYLETIPLKNLDLPLGDYYLVGTFKGVPSHSKLIKQIEIIP